MTSKRFMKLQIIFIVLFALTIINNTFAWAPRPAVQGGGFMSELNSDGDTAISMDKSYFTAMQLVTPEKAYFVNGNSCTAVTYKGTLDEETGKIIYDDENENITNPSTIENFTDEEMDKDEIHYFKTVITNTSEVKTNVSLFISGYTANELTTAVFGVTTPVTTRGSLTQSDYDYGTGLRYYDFVPIISKFEVLGAKDGVPATTTVEWFVFNDAGNTTSKGEFKISDINFTNN